MGTFEFEASQEYTVRPYLGGGGGGRRGVRKEGGKEGSGVLWVSGEPGNKHTDTAWLRAEGL